MEKEQKNLFKLDIDFDSSLELYSNIDIKYLEVIPKNSKAKPFVKWVGGKRGIMEELIKYIPNKINDYYEPFIGGGALFFEIKDKANKCFISDINFELIITYIVIKKDLDRLLNILEIHKKKHCKEYYLKIRNKQKLVDPIERAGRFIYLNKTCYNGLYRVNKSGNFNTPMGTYKNPNILDIENLILCNKALKDTYINFYDFSSIQAKKDDFVYFDPPYHPTGINSFTNYTKLDFTEKDQLKLRDFALYLIKSGVKVMISNSDSEYIRNIYDLKEFNINIIKAPRSVNCMGNKRKPVNELLIMSY